LKEPVGDFAGAGSDVKVRAAHFSCGPAAQPCFLGITAVRLTQQQVPTPQPRQSSGIGTRCSK
jgi:hypothetical protein